jgi:hypothetical protein
MSYWLARLADCIQPLHQRVLIACPQNSHTGLRAWAEMADFPDSNILNCPQGAGEVEQLAACLSASPPSGPVLVVKAGYILGASFDAARMLQLAAVRDRDVICFTATQSSPQQQHQGFAVRPTGTGVCPLLELGGGASSGSGTFRSLPFYVLTQATARAAASSRAASLEEFLEGRASANPVYGLEVPEVWSAEAWGAHQAALHSKAQAAEQPAPGEQLPQRFTDAGLWEYEVKAEHPAYSTSSNTWGQKPPSQHELPPTWAGIQGGLNCMGGGGGGRGNTGLRTGKRRSKAHSSFDW